MSGLFLNSERGSLLHYPEGAASGPNSCSDGFLHVVTACYRLCVYMHLRASPVNVQLDLKYNNKVTRTYSAGCSRYGISQRQKALVSGSDETGPLFAIRHIRSDATESSLYSSPISHPSRINTRGLRQAPKFFYDTLRVIEPCRS